jgi:hypothetical protein
VYSYRLGMVSQHVGLASFLYYFAAASKRKLDSIVLIDYNSLEDIALKARYTSCLIQPYLKT